MVTAGAATLPGATVLRHPRAERRIVEQLGDICRRSRAVWVLYTFPRYLDAAVPAVAEMIRKEFTVVRVFPGTVGDGDVFVGRFGK